MPKILDPNSLSEISGWRFDEADLVRDRRCDDEFCDPQIGMVCQIFVDVGDALRLVLVRVLWSTGLIEDLVGESIDNALQRVCVGVRLPLDP